jgi:ribosomal protein S12 methylthiotransferase
MALQRKISRRNLRRMVGKSLPVLVEGPSEETELLYQGRSERQAPGIDGCILINDIEGPAPQPGDFRWATIIAAGDYDLVGRLEAQVFAERRSPANLLPAGGALVQIQPAATVP